MEHLVQDIRYGIRGFLRQPAFSLAAIMALALGIGANTAVFSVVHAVLLKPLPFPNPEALLFVHDTYPAVPSASISFAKLVALRERSRTLTALGGFAPAGLTITGSSEPEQVPGARVSAGFFKAAGVQPLVGRWFTSLVLTRSLETLLYEVSPTDPFVLGATCAGVLLVAALASVVPALRALGVDPVVALRAE